MITANTTLCAIFGHPIKHSLSPVMHNAGFMHLKLPYCYVAFDVLPDKLSYAIEAIRVLNMRGVNITVPHKEAVIKLLDYVDEEAKAIGAVNTIVNDNQVLKGYNTDAKGFEKSLLEAGISPKSQTALLLGAGGSAKAIAYALSKEVGKLIIYNRTMSKAEDLKNHIQSLKSTTCTIEVIDNLALTAPSDVDLIVNTTSLGLHSDDPMPIHKEFLLPKHIVYDLIYHQTKLQETALVTGCRVLNGLGMLLWQGVLAFELWTGVKAPVEVMRRQLHSLA